MLSNDTDIDVGDVLTITAVGGAVNGTVVEDRGTIIFTPTANFNGSGSFDYSVEDGHGGSDTATVTVDIAPINNNPVAVAVDDGATTDEDMAVAIAKSALLGNDTDVDVGDVLSIASVQNAAGGSVQDAGATVTFTPAGEYSGPASFEYTVSDWHGGSDVAFYLQAHGDGADRFIFSYSLDGDTYTDMVTVAKTSDDDTYQTYGLPAGLRGVVYVRALDSDTSKGETTEDDGLFIDHMSVRCAIATVEASNPTPGDMAVGVNPDIVLNWTPGIGAVYHDVYFGTDIASLPLVSSRQSGTSFDPRPSGTLAENTTYYWAVDEFDGSGAPLAIGPVWTFTTAAACTATTMHVESIVLETVAAEKGTKLGMATVTIRDNCGNPAPDAVVEGHFEGDFTDDFTGASAQQTDAAGQVVYVSAGPATKRPTFDFVVDDVTLAGMTYSGAGASASTFSDE